MKKPVLKYFLILLTVICAAPSLRADDETASGIYREAFRMYQDGEYYDAAKKFSECRIYAKNPAIRANSLKAEIAAFRMCKLYYREFLAIEELLERYPDYADCNELIAREFEIGKLFRQGVREPAFWIFRWIPYLLDVDRTGEVYSAALARAPFSKFAPEAHLQLALWYELEGDTLKSISHLRRIVEDHPAAAEFKYSLLALANGLFGLAGRGDGDSRYINESVELFRLFCDKYPDAPEVEFARNRLAQAKDIQAAKLFEIAEFYRKSGRSDVAERYLAQVMSEYPDSEKAQEAEKTLVDISQDYLPVNPPAKIDPRLPDLKSYKIPDNAELLLVSPGDRNSPYLLNVPDLKGEKLPALQGKGERVK